MLRRARRIVLDARVVVSRVHGFVQNRRRNLGRRELAIDDERELDETDASLGKIGAAAGEASDLSPREVAMQPAEIRRLIPLDQFERRIEPRKDVLAVDVGARVDERHGEAANGLLFREGGASTAEDSFQFAEHSLRREKLTGGSRAPPARSRAARRWRTRPSSAATRARHALLLCSRPAPPGAAQ